MKISISDDVLQAGHRSVFKEGYHSTGGGSAKSSSKKLARKGMPKDDLARVNYEIDRILDNHLLSGITGESRSRDQRVLRNFLMDVNKAVADDMIDIGKRSRVFDEIDQRILEKNAISGKELDLLVANIDFEQEFPHLGQRGLESFVHHSEEQGKRHRLKAQVLDDFTQIIETEFVKRGGWGQKLSSPVRSCLGRLSSLLSSNY